MSKKTILGKFALVLHSHLPYVIEHGVWPHGMDWLFEAASETYIPILKAMNRLIREGISPKVTIGITPVLVEQLKDKAFQDGFKVYLENKIKVSRDDKRQFEEWGDKHLLSIACMWEDFYNTILTLFKEDYKEDIVGAFKMLQDMGHIEIITSCATHGYLPLIGRDTAVQAQIKQGIQTYRRYFERDPKGIWLPECAYRPRYKWKSPIGGDDGVMRKGIEEFLSENKIEYFIIDSHLLKGGNAIGVYMDRFESLKKLWGQFEKEYKPRHEDVEKCPHEVYYVGSVEGKKPVAVFTRDPKTGMQVWSGEYGYPGDEWYLEFHKKRFPGGLRYWRVTGSKSDLADKSEYEPDRVSERIEENANHFKWLIKTTLKECNHTQGIVCAPFDAELFGHWWFEGPEWIYRVLRLIHDDPELELSTCGGHLDSQTKETVVVSLPEGSWGEGGFHWIWLNEWTMWTWKHVYEAEKEMERLARELNGTGDEKLETILKQAARELLLLESSDWQFLISTWSARDYAEIRVTGHYHDFKKLSDMAWRYSRDKRLNEGDWNFLASCQKRDSIFSDIDVGWFSKVEFPI